MTRKQRKSEWWRVGRKERRRWRMRRGGGEGEEGSGDELRLPSPARPRARVHSLDEAISSLCSCTYATRSIDHPPSSKARAAEALSLLHLARAQPLLPSFLPSPSHPHPPPSYEAFSHHCREIRTHLFNKKIFSPPAAQAESPPPSPPPPFESDRSSSFPVTFFSAAMTTPSVARMAITEAALLMASIAYSTGKKGKREEGEVRRRERWREGGEVEVVAFAPSTWEVWRGTVSRRYMHGDIKTLRRAEKARWSRRIKARRAAFVRRRPCRPSPRSTFAPFD